MGRSEGETNGPVDADGVRVVTSRPRRRDTWLVIAAGLVIVGGALHLATRPDAPSPPSAAPTVSDGPMGGPAAGRVGASVPEPPDSRAEVRRREVVARRIARRTLPRTRGPSGKPEIAAADAITALRDAGVTEGIAAFGLPGTNPPRRGVIVPEDAVLPEGYVRHHQTTDDGRALPPILIFHPDYEFLDEAGNPIKVPADRVVPPEHVPAGIPIEIMEPPGDQTSAPDGPR